MSSTDITRFLLILLKKYIKIVDWFFQCAITNQRTVFSQYFTQINNLSKKNQLNQLQLLDVPTKKFSNKFLVQTQKFYPL